MLIGTLGSARRARVSDGGGLITPAGIGIGWWALAGERWLVPGADLTTRQSLVDDMPIVRTAVRAGAGDLVSHTYAARQGRRELAVMHLANGATGPVLAAIVVTGATATMAGASVLVGGVPVAHLPQAPRTVVTIAAGESVAAALGDHIGERVGDSGPSARALSGTVGPGLVALVPLTHTTWWSVAVPIDLDAPAVERAAVPVVSALPGPDDVARGWKVQLRSGFVIDGDDQGASSRTSAAVAALLLAADANDASLPGRHAPLGTDASLDVATALARAGHGAAAQRLLDSLDLRPARGGAWGVDGEKPTVELSARIISALSMSVVSTCDRDTASTIAAAIAGAAEHVIRSKREVADSPGLLACLPWAASLLRLADEDRGADDARRAWDRGGRPGPLPSPVLTGLPARAVGASLVADDPRRIAAQLVTELDALVTDRGDGVLALVAGTRHTTPGTSLSVRGLRTSAGEFGFALRWHGARPAVLWETVDPLCEPELSAPVLGRGWSGAGPRGEALLAG